MATDAQIERLREFISPPRIAMVATIGKDGLPQLTPNWYAYTDGEIIISITKQRVKYRNVIRDPTGGGFDLLGADGRGVRNGERSRQDYRR